MIRSNASTLPPVQNCVLNEWCNSTLGLPAVHFTNKSCPISRSQFEDSFTDTNFSRSEVNFNVNEDKPECALPIPGHAFTYMNLNEQCAESVVPGENVVGLPFEPRCMVIVIAPDSRRDLLDQLLAAGRPLADPIRVLVNFTISTEEDPDVNSANVNCQNSRVLHENYLLDRVLQDEFTELAEVRAKRATTIELRQFLEFSLDNRTHQRPNPFHSLTKSNQSSALWGRTV